MTSGVKFWVAYSVAGAAVVGVEVAALEATHLEGEEMGVATTNLQIIICVTWLITAADGDSRQTVSRTCLPPSRTLPRSFDVSTASVTTRSVPLRQDKGVR